MKIKEHTIPFCCQNVCVWKGARLRPAPSAYPACLMTFAFAFISFRSVWCKYSQHTQKQSTKTFICFSQACFHLPGNWELFSRVFFRALSDKALVCVCFFCLREGSGSCIEPDQSRTHNRLDYYIHVTRTPLYNQRHEVFLSVAHQNMQPPAASNLRDRQPRICHTQPEDSPLSGRCIELVL